MESRPEDLEFSKAGDALLPLSGRFSSAPSKPAQTTALSTRWQHRLTMSPKNVQRQKPHHSHVRCNGSSTRAPVLGDNALQG